MRAVIFDMDGVLVNTDESHFRSWVALAEEEGIPLDQALYDARMRGVGRRRALTALLERAQRPYSEAEQQNLARRKNDIFLELIRNNAPRPLSGVLRLIGELRERGLKIGVASSSKNTKLILEVSGLALLFDAVADGNVEPSKPDPGVFLAAAEQLGVEPWDCVVIEDSRDGVQAARSAGMAVFAVGPRERFPEVHCVAPDLAEVTAGDILAAA